MTLVEIIVIIVSAVLGGSGIVGLAFYYMRSYIDNKLKAAEKEADKKKEINRRRAIIEEKQTHVYGRCFFWMHKVIVDQKHGGDLDRIYADLEKAFDDLQAVENEKKALDQEIIAQYGGR